MVFRWRRYTPNNLTQQSGNLMIIETEMPVYQLGFQSVTLSGSILMHAGLPVKFYTLDDSVMFILTRRYWADRYIQSGMSQSQVAAHARKVRLGEARSRDTWTRRTEKQAAVKGMPNSWALPGCTYTLIYCNLDKVAKKIFNFFISIFYLTNRRDHGSESHQKHMCCRPNVTWEA